MPRTVAIASRKRGRESFSASVIAEKDSRPLFRSGADDTRAGEAVVDSTMIAAQYGEEAEAGGRHKHEPHQLSDEGAPKVERGTRLGGHHLDAGGHFSERLTSGGERHEVAAVLDEEKRQQRGPRQDAKILESDAANLHREVHNGGVDPRQDQRVGDERRE